MKNKEKYAKEIKGIAKYGQRVAVDRNGKPRSCLGFGCKRRMRHKEEIGRCGTKRLEWFQSEAKKTQAYVINEELEKVKRENGKLYNSGEVINIIKRIQWYER